MEVEFEMNCKDEILFQALELRGKFEATASSASELYTLYCDEVRGAGNDEVARR